MEKVPRKVLWAMPWGNTHYRSQSTSFTCELGTRIFRVCGQIELLEVHTGKDLDVTF